jgi:CxxC motif-containing protein
MSKKEMTCIVCPNGCQLEASFENSGPGLQVTEITGHLCEKGPVWAEQELTHPVRTVISSVQVDGGDLPLVSVRTDAPVPRNMIFDVMKAIKAAKTTAPVAIGQVLIRQPAGTGCNIIATKNISTRIS